MHEMSIVSSLLEMIDGEMKKHGVEKLLVVEVHYGVMAGIVPEALSFAFEALTTGTKFEGAVLETKEIPLTLTCSRCGHTFTPAPEERYFADCPACGSPGGHKVTGGRELYLQRIEAE